MLSRGVSIALWVFATALWPPWVSMCRASDVDQQDFAKVERGRYLVQLSDCGACHTDPDGGRPFAGGRPIETPFGYVVSANITPDLETGIGKWSTDEFDKALRRGIRADGSHLYPAMPYTAYAKMSRADSDAIEAYLATIPPIRNSVKSNQLPFPFNVRFVMVLWNWLFFDNKEFKPDSSRSAQWNRGAFLVNGPGHCGACHTPKNLLGGDKVSRALQGAVVQGWFAPNVTGDMTRGLGQWSAKDIAELLHTGHNRHTAVTGPMAEEIADASAHFDNKDLMAIAIYLKSLGGRGASDQRPISADDPAMQAGKAIYRDTCAACHGLDGRGIAKLFPALPQTATVRAEDPTTVIRVLLQGARSVATEAEPTAPAMPSFAWQLNDDQAAAVLTYIRNSWGVAAPAVSGSRVKKERENLGKRDQPNILSLRAPR